MAELSTLYSVAKSFADLRQRAEDAFLPDLLDLGTRLRGLLRRARLGAAEVERAAEDVLRLRSQWQGALEALRASPAYQSALRAWAANDQAGLAAEIPRVFAGVQVVQPVPTLFFPVSPSSGRRRPGASPFLSAGDAAQRIMGLLAAGLEPEASGSDWWDCELAYIAAADELGGLDTPIALRMAPADCDVAVFCCRDDPSFRLFTPRLQARLTVVLAAEAGDEWWQAYDESYASFRQRLHTELEKGGVRLSD